MVKIEPRELENGGLSLEVQRLLMNKYVMVIGDSNHRSVYKDLVLLLQKNDLMTESETRAKGELTFHNDILQEGGVKGRLNNGINYTEVRMFFTHCHLVKFCFVTRCYNSYVESILQQICDGPTPDLFIMNSCLWDLTRYGQDPIRQYRDNMQMLCGRLVRVLRPDTVVIWTTTLPVSKKARGGFLTPEVEYRNRRLTADVLEANYEARNIVINHGFSVLDLHFWFRNKLHLRKQDGVHWCAVAHRYISELLLTYLAYQWNIPFPPISSFPSSHPVAPREPQPIELNSLIATVQQLESSWQKTRQNAPLPYSRPAPYHVPMLHSLFPHSALNQCNPCTANFNTVSVDGHCQNTWSQAPSCLKACNNPVTLTALSALETKLFEIAEVSQGQSAAASKLPCWSAPNSKPSTVTSQPACQSTSTSKSSCKSTPPSKTSSQNTPTPTAPSQSTPSIESSGESTSNSNPPCQSTPNSEPPCDSTSTTESFCESIPTSKPPCQSSPNLKPLTQSIPNSEPPCESTHTSKPPSQNTLTSATTTLSSPGSCAGACRRRRQNRHSVEPYPSKTVACETQNHSSKVCSQSQALKSEECSENHVKSATSDSLVTESNASSKIEPAKSQAPGQSKGTKSNADSLATSSASSDKQTTKSDASSDNWATNADVSSEDQATKSDAPSESKATKSDASVQGQAAKSEASAERQITKSEISENQATKSKAVPMIQTIKSEPLWLREYETPSCQNNRWSVNYETPCLQNNNRPGNYETRCLQNNNRPGNYETPCFQNNNWPGNYETPCFQNNNWPGNYETPCLQNNNRPGNYETPCFQNNNWPGNYETPCLQNNNWPGNYETPCLQNNNWPVKYETPCFQNNNWPGNYETPRFQNNNWPGNFETPRFHNNNWPGNFETPHFHINNWPGNFEIPRFHNNWPVKYETPDCQNNNWPVKYETPHCQNNNWPTNYQTQHYQTGGRWSTNTRQPYQTDWLPYNDMPPYMCANYKAQWRDQPAMDGPFFQNQPGGNGPISPDVLNMLPQNFSGFTMPRGPVPCEFFNNWTDYSHDRFLGAHRRPCVANRAGYSGC